MMLKDWGMERTPSIRPIRMTVARWYWEVPLDTHVLDVEMDEDTLRSTTCVEYEAGWTFTRRGAHRAARKAILDHLKETAA